MGEEWWEVEVSGGLSCESPSVCLPAKRNEGKGGWGRESKRVDTVKVCCVHAKLSQ